MKGGSVKQIIAISAALFIRSPGPATREEPWRGSSRGGPSSAVGTHSRSRPDAAAPRGERRSASGPLGERGGGPRSRTQRKPPREGKGGGGGGGGRGRGSSARAAKRALSG